MAVRICNPTVLYYLDHPCGTIRVVAAFLQACCCRRSFWPLQMELNSVQPPIFAREPQRAMTDTLRRVSNGSKVPLSSHWHTVQLRSGLSPFCEFDFLAARARSTENAALPNFTRCMAEEIAAIRPDRSTDQKADSQVADDAAIAVSDLDATIFSQSLCRPRQHKR